MLKGHKQEDLGVQEKTLYEQLVSAEKAIVAN